MFLNSYKVKYPRATKNFFVNLVEPFIEATSDIDAKMALAEFTKTQTIGLRRFYLLRKKIADYHDRKHLDYVTSPESETYWAS